MVAYTKWPSDIGATVNLCVYSENLFGEAINLLNARSVNGRYIVIQFEDNINFLPKWQAIFIANSVINNLPFIPDSLNKKPILTSVDSKDAASQGVIINMRGITQNKIKSEADPKAALRAGLNLSSRLLHLATKVSQ